MRSGALTRAHRSFVQQLEVGREINDAKQRAYALQGIGQVLMLQGDLSGAKLKWTEALQLRQALKEDGLAAGSEFDEGESGAA